MKFLKKLFPSNLHVILTLHIVAIVSSITLICFKGFIWQTWVLAAVMYGLRGMSIGCGYHRLFAHRSYQSHKILELFYLFFGAGTMQASALEWCSIHRRHHQFSDTNQDPHSAKKGFWYAHMLWLNDKDAVEVTDNVRDLERNKLAKFQHKHYIAFLLTSGFLLPMGIAMLWGDLLGGLIIAGMLAITALHHATWCVNSVCHLWGTQPYDKREQARNNFIISLIAFGEGYHNYHHSYPYDYRNGRKIYEWDPNKWFIRAMSYVKLTTELKYVKRKVVKKRRQSAKEAWLDMTALPTKAVEDH